MSFLSLNQQHQSTEGLTVNKINCKCNIITHAVMHFIFIMIILWSLASAVHQSAAVDHSVLSSEQFRSSVFCCRGPVDLEFATWQSSRPSTESQHV